MLQVENINTRATRMKYGPRIPNGVSHRRQEKPREVVLAPVQKTEDPADYDAFPWLNIKDGGTEIFDFALAPSTVPSPKIEDGKDGENNKVTSLSEVALRKGIVHGFFDKAKKGVLATAAMFVVAGCGVSAPDSVGGIRMPWAGSEQPVITQTDNQRPAVTTEQTVQQDVSTYAKYLTTLTFPTEDPNYGWKAHKGGKVEAYLAEFYGAMGEDGVFDPQRDAFSYETRRADDSEYTNRYNAGLDLFRKLNAGLGSYPDDDPWVHIRSPKNEIVEFKSLTREGWKEFFEDHGGKYVPKPTSTPEPETLAGTPAQAEPTVTESKRATSIPASERLPGGLRPWYIKTAADGDPRVSGNYARSAETNPLLQRFFKEQGRQRIEEIGVTTVRNAARFIAERVPGVSEQALAAVFKAGEHKIAYRASDGTVKFTSVIVGERTDELNHQISQDEEVLAFKIIYLDGREAIRLLRVMCIQEFEEEVPVPKVTPTATTTRTLVPGQLAIPVAAPSPSATLRPPRILPTETPRPVTEYRAPATPITYEQLPSPVREFVRTLPPGQQVVIKLFDANNNGFCEPGDLPPQNVQGVVFAIEFLSARDGVLAPERRVVYTNHLGIAIGDFRPNGEPFRVIEFVRPGERIIYAQSEGRAGQFGVSGFDQNRAMPAVFCNGREINLAPTATSTTTSTPSPTPTATLRPGETATATATAAVTSTVPTATVASPTETPRPNLTATSTAVSTLTSTLTETPTATRTATSTATPVPSPTATDTPRPTPTVRSTATPQSFPTSSPTVRSTATPAR